MGCADNSYVPSFSGENSLDGRAQQEIQVLQDNLKESAKIAASEGRYDEEADYINQYERIQSHLKNDFIGPGKVKNLYSGEILLALTHCVRQRKLRALARFRREGFKQEADDLRRSFDVQNRAIVFREDVCDFNWLLNPDG